MARGMQRSQPPRFGKRTRSDLTVLCVSSSTDSNVTREPSRLRQRVLRVLCVFSCKTAGVGVRLREDSRGIVRACPWMEGRGAALAGAIVFAILLAVPAAAAAGPGAGHGDGHEAVPMSLLEGIGDRCAKTLDGCQVDSDEADPGDPSRLRRLLGGEGLRSGELDDQAGLATRDLPSDVRRYTAALHKWTNGSWFDAGPKGFPHPEGSWAWPEPGAFSPSSGRRTADERSASPGSQAAANGWAKSHGDLVRERGSIPVDVPVAWFLVSSAVVALGLGPLLRLYRQLSRDDVLDNDVRASILETVREEPGITRTEISDELGVARQTVAYHVRILDEVDMLAARDAGRATRLFVVGDHDRRIRDLVDELRRDGRSKVLELIRDEPGIRLAEIARRLDCHPSTAKYHADALAEKGLVDERGDGGRRLELPDDVEATWRRLRS